MKSLSHPVASTLVQIEKELNSYFLEREDAVRVLLLAILSGEHAFILGPPGTAKSQLVRAVVRRLTDARYFEVGLSKTRPAEAVLGPLDIKEFRENGNYFLKRAGYASQVEFAFLDEIGKMSPVLGHDLLALLNERVYHEVNGGRSVHQSPLSSAFCASNEMITNDSDDAAALWDRLLFRVQVDYLNKAANFAALLSGGHNEAGETSIDWAELQDAITKQVPTIGLSGHALKALVKLRKTLAREHIHPSDRRWKASVRALQAAAFLDGDAEILDDHLAVLQFTLWDTTEQIEKVQRLCLEASNPYVKPLLETADMLKEIIDRIEGYRGMTTNLAAATDYARDGGTKLESVRGRLDTLLMEAEGRPIPGFKKVSDLHWETVKNLSVVCLTTDEEVAVKLADRKAGMGDGGNK